MLGVNDFSVSASLIADPTRAAMLAALIDGRALPAGELAYAAGVTPQTASAHLAKLLDGSLLQLETEGRHRYFRLAGPHVAEVLERLATLAPPGPPRARALSREARNLRFCRRCYDHLAGQMGVALADALQARAYLVGDADKQFRVTPPGKTWFARHGISVDTLKPTRRGLARQCLDCSERRHHLAGPLGVTLLTRLCAEKWLRSVPDSRRIHVTPTGWKGFADELGIRQEDVENGAAAGT